MSNLHKYFLIIDILAFAILLGMFFIPKNIIINEPHYIEQSFFEN